uniref:Uncharacterized protein n=1 Tax=Ditylum brightwellii TaxID=49249 RepID=A0A7S4R0Y4_9STRA
MVRIKRCNSETIRALTDFLPSLRKSIFNSTDLSQPTKMLKKIRLEKRQLQQHLEEDDNGDDVEQQLELLQLKEEKQWDILKNRSLTRVITTAYAHVLLYLVLLVQVHLLGGRLFRDEFEQQRRELIEDDSPKDETSSTTPASTSESSSSYRESHRIVLTRTYERFLSESVSNLAKDVEDLAEDVLRHWHVMGADDDDRKTNENEIYHDNEEKNCTDITSYDLENKINEIRDVMEGYVSNYHRRRRRPNGIDSHCNHRRRRYGSNLIQFIIPGIGEDDLDKKNNKDEQRNELAEYILNETWDILESPIFEKAEEECLNVTFEILKEDGWGLLFEEDDDDDDDELEENNGVQLLKTQDEEEQPTLLPLAHVVAQLRHVTKGFFETTTISSASSTTNDFFLSLSNLEDEMDCNEGQPNDYVLELQRLPSVKGLCNVSFA